MTWEPGQVRLWLCDGFCFYLLGSFTFGMPVVYLIVQEYCYTYIVVARWNKIVWYIKNILRSLNTESSLIRTQDVLNFSTMHAKNLLVHPLLLGKHFGFFYVWFDPGDIIDRIDLLKKNSANIQNYKRSSLLLFALIKSVLCSSMHHDASAHPCNICLNVSNSWLG